MGIKIIVATVLRFILAAVGLIFLSCGSFSQNQFQDDAKWKAMFFISFSLCVAVFVYIPRKCNVMLEKLCDMHFFVRALVKFLLLGLYSVLLFVTKYPSFKFHPKYSDGQKLEQGHGNHFDLYGIGSFSVLALFISWERQDQTQEFGVFEFLLQLTMDASMEIKGLDGKPNVWYVVGAYVYCFLLLIVQSCRRSWVSGSGNDCTVDRQETYLELLEMGLAETDRRRRDSQSIIGGGVLENRDGILDGQTIEEDGLEVDGLRRRKRKTKQEARSSFETSSEGEGLDDELSKFETCLMEERLAKAQLVVPESELELHCGPIREKINELQKLARTLDLAPTSTCTVM